MYTAQLLTAPGTHLLSSFPFGELTKPLLSCPHTGVDDLQEQLTSARVEDEDASIDGLSGQITLKGLVDGHPMQEKGHISY